MKVRSKLKQAVDKLAECVENGHLLASLGGEDLLNAATDKIVSLQAELETVQQTVKEYSDPSVDIDMMVQTTDELVEARRRIERLEAFVRMFITCPCCEETEECSDECTYEIDCPVLAVTMDEAREAMKERTE